MSNGSRLVAVVVVVVLAAIGLYYAFIYNPGGAPAKPLPATPTNTPPAPPAGGLEASKSGVTGGEATSPQGGTITPPPEGAFAPAGGSAGTAGAGSTQPSGSVSGAGITGAGTTGAGTPGTGSGTAGVGGSNVVPPPSIKGTPVPTGSGGTKSGEAAPSLTPGMEYTVQSGDTLEGLARRFLHDGSKWRAIADANPGLTPNTLKIGQTIKIPGADKAGSTTAGGTGTGTGTSGTAGGQSGTQNSGGGNSYTVQKGDTLIGIARKVYGSDSDWKRILEANSSVLKGNAEAIRPGMKLTIPPKR